MTFVVARFVADTTNTFIGDNANRVNYSPTFLQTTIVGAQPTALSTTTSSISNFAALGYDTNQFAASNRVRIGNSSITSAHVQVAWTVTSDARLKTNVKDLDLGTEFVKTLRPVSYKRINSEESEELGFIAQEVEAVLPRPLSLLSIDNQGTYGLRKEDLIAVLVKTVQELESRLLTAEQELKSIKEKL